MNQHQAYWNTTLMLIQEKAKSLFGLLKMRRGKDANVKSRDWFQRFKARTNLHNVKLEAEAPSADRVTAGDLPSLQFG